MASYRKSVGCMLQISFHVLKRLNPEISAYFIGYTNSKPRSQGKLAFLGSFFTCLASFNLVFFELGWDEPKVLLNCFWEYFIQTCLLFLEGLTENNRSCCSEVALGAFKSPQGSPIRLERLIFTPCNLLISINIRINRNYIISLIL